MTRIKRTTYVLYDKQHRRYARLFNLIDGFALLVDALVHILSLGHYTSDYHAQWVFSDTVSRWSDKYGI